LRIVPFAASCSVPDSTASVASVSNVRPSTVRVASPTATVCRASPVKITRSVRESGTALGCQFEASPHASLAWPVQRYSFASAPAAMLNIAINANTLMHDPVEDDRRLMSSDYTGWMESPALQTHRRAGAGHDLCDGLLRRGCAVAQHLVDVARVVHEFLAALARRAEV